MLAGTKFPPSRPRAVLSRTHSRQVGQNVHLASYLRSHLPVKALALSRSELMALEDQIFNRKDELATLNLRFNEDPSELLILLGPPDTGITRIFRELKKVRDAARAQEGDGPPPLLFLNCRGKGFTSPLGVARVIRDLVIEDPLLEEWWKTVPNFWVAGEVKVPGYQTDLKKLFELSADKTPVASIIDSLTIFFEATRPLPYKPVIIIDNAFVLMRWGEDPGNTQLKDLLNFFVKTAKEEHLGHIVLACSESFLVDFLEDKGLDAKDYVSHVIGNLATSEEAKEFIEHRRRCGQAPPTFFDTTEDGEQIDMWPRVYEVCGGNIYSLERCAGHAKNEGSWEAGLETISRNSQSRLSEGLWPEGFTGRYGVKTSAAWTKEDYKTVLREIALAKDHKHAVSLKKLQKMVGKKAVLSLMEWNFLNVRPKSSWAKDIPESVFTELGDEKLVTMFSTIDVSCVVKMYEAGKLDASSPGERIKEFFKG